MNKQTPSQGLKILEELHKKMPNNQWIRRNLINAYIKLGYHDIALNMIADIPDNKTGVQSLKFKAWQLFNKGKLDNQKQIWDKILDKSYLASIHADTNVLMQISKKDVDIKANDIVLFTHIYNEMLRLPNFISYYRELGVTQFFVIDNNSMDGCQEFLLAQPDVHLFWTNEDHTRSGEGMVWYQKLIDEYLQDNWMIVADADEFLVYPDCEKRKLLELTEYLDANKYEAMGSFMLDMFPKNLTEQLNISADLTFIEQSPYFYNQYRFVGHIDPPYWNVDGGIFYYLSQFLPPLIKTPLIKASAGIRYIQTHHRITPAHMAPITSVFLHFKFMGDFQKKSKESIKGKRYWGGGAAYRKYSRIYDETVDDVFDFSKLDKTVKYQNSQQLIDLGLIQCPQEWTDFVSKQ